MREILFRGKRIDNGEWVEGFLLKECNYATCSWNLAIEYKTDRFGKFAYDVAEIIPESISEFTGLTDKNGKKIFEGDILSVLVNEMAYPEQGSFEEDVLGRRKIPTGNKVRTVWSVEYRCRNSTGNTFYVFGKDRRFSHVLTGNTVYNANAKVIGNIHDNPELLLPKGE